MLQTNSFEAAGSVSGGSSGCHIPSSSGVRCYCHKHEAINDWQTDSNQPLASQALCPEMGFLRILYRLGCLQGSAQDVAELRF